MFFLLLVTFCFIIIIKKKNLLTLPFFDVTAHVIFAKSNNSAATANYKQQHQQKGNRIIATTFLQRRLLLDFICMRPQLWGQRRHVAKQTHFNTHTPYMCLYFLHASYHSSASVCIWTACNMLFVCAFYTPIVNLHKRRYANNCMHSHLYTHM